MFKDIAIGAEDLGFDSRAGQFGHSVANAEKFFGAVLPKREAADMGTATRYTLCCNAATITKIGFFYLMVEQT